MPLYQTKCDACSSMDTVFRKVDERDNLPQCAVCTGALSRVISLPMIAPDLAPYQSPNGSYIVDGRKARQEDLKRWGAIAWEPGIEKDIARRKVYEQEKAFQPLSDAVDRIVTEMNVSGKLE